MSDKQLTGLSQLLSHRKLAISIAVGAILFSSLLYLLKKRQRRLQISLIGDRRSAVIPATEAGTRAPSLSAVTYDVKLNLLETEYKGSWRCTFTLKAAASGLNLDFAGKRIVDFRVNHVAVVPVWKEGRIAIDKVEVGHNEVEIRFENEYEEGGLWAEAGIVMFAGCPGRANLHRVIPCFDQPDIKSTFKLFLTAPQSWQVLTTDFTQSLNNFVGCCPDPDPIFDTEATKTSTLHEFYHSARCSPEHFAVCAGQFSQFSVQASNRITVYCRPHLAHKVNLKVQFDTIQHVLSHMKKTTGVPYCFPKLDIVFLPRPSGYAASILFLNEGLLSEDWSYNRVTGELTEVMVHGLVAQWVGILVTYKLHDDFPAWNKLIAAISDDFFSRQSLSSQQTDSLKRIFSLHKWSNCPSSALVP